MNNILIGISKEKIACVDWSDLPKGKIIKDEKIIEYLKEAIKFLKEYEKNTV